MRESRLYLNFLKNNLLVLIVLSVTGASIGWFYQLRQPTNIERSSLWEMNYNQTNVVDRIALADQAVTLMRSAQLSNKLQIEADLTAFKPGPLALTLTASSISLDQSQVALGRAEEYLKSHYPVSEVGQATTVTKPPNLMLGLSFGLMVGLTVGLIISLARAYFSYY